MRTAPTSDRPSVVSGLVSVVIPAHNAAEWIGETIASVAAQTYAPLEIIVADDRSTDDTVPLAERNPAVRVVRSPRPGPGATRNVGLDAARGEFVQLLDADDLLAPTKVGRQVRALTATGADVAWEPFHLLERSGPERAFGVGPRVCPQVGEDVAASLLTTHGFVQIGALLIRRTPRTVDVRFAEERESVEDVRFAAELAMRGARFVSTDVGEAGLLYRQHTGPRYSGRPRPEFARACAANAAWAQAWWERETPEGLTGTRRSALAEAYLFAARQLASVDDRAFRDAAARLAAVDAGFARRLPPGLRWLTRMVGYSRAEAVAARWRRTRERITPTVEPARERTA